MTQAPQATPPGRLIPLLLATSGLLVFAGIGFFAFATTRSQPAAKGSIAVTVTASACEPAALEVPAGQVSFQITNRSDRAVEWEILDGVMVLAERENIAPGFSSVLSERLKPGVYQITCGLLSNPRGTLTVRETAESAAETAAPPLRDFLGPLSERRVQMIRAAGKFTRSTKALHDAIGAGDLALAQGAWAQAAQDWASLGMLAPRAADLQNRIAPQAAFLAGREADPGFIGLQRLEYGLFAQAGLADLAPVAATLATDALALQARLKTLDTPPEAIAADAARYAASLSAAELASGLAPYAGADRAQLTAALDSIGRAAGLLSPLLPPETAQPVAQALATAKAAATATPADRQATAAALDRLATALATINPKLGLER